MADAYANPLGPGSALPSDLRDYYLNFGNPAAGFYHYLGENRSGGSGQGSFNYNGNDTQSNWAQSQFGRLQNQYAANAADEPGLGFYDYLKRQNLPNQYAMQTPAQQGFFSSIVTPRARMIVR